jgi:bifunctional DNA-binding transcriptional regulator/antitoxin component of YhaV-PrlF toxin-antitoxin module
MDTIKTVNKNGLIHIPKKIRQQLPSDKFTVKIIELNGKKVIVLEPVGIDKKPITVYE